ncbi:hypothetical protein CK203_049800 [Vitis vinifera]|uniref:Kinetochore protein NDC80 n=1 Tax=Vitis vinifera TaxID=29760 RepID=A0A438H2S2_VITVI|nr:hypothetical protein CK203_049800 [Vitis vinifera]
MSVSLEQDDQVIRLLDNRSVDKHKKDGYNFIHFGMIQVAAKPLTRLGAVQAGLNDGPVYFQCYPNFTVRIRDADILDSVVLHIKTHGFKIKPGNSPVFPFWFYSWWNYYGPNIKILPKPILDGFELFRSSFNIPKELSAFPPLLFFFSKFGLAWIVQWDYIIITDESTVFPSLGRTFKTKWWDALKNDASINTVKQYFLQNPTQVSASDDMSQFLLKKQQLQAMLAAAKTPQDFQKILEEGSSSFSQENSYAESDDSTSYLPDNGDDCEGSSGLICKHASFYTFLSRAYALPPLFFLSHHVNPSSFQAFFKLSYLCPLTLSAHHHQFNRDSDASFASSRPSSLGINRSSTGDALTDRSYQFSAIRTINFFLASHSSPLSLKPPLPSTKDISETLKFLISQLDFPTTKLEDDLPILLKHLNCPIKLNKPTLKAPGTPHAWSPLLGVMHWLVQIALYNDHLVSNLLCFDNTFVYALVSYLHYIRGDDDGMEAVDREFMGKLERERDAVAEGVKALEKEVTEREGGWRN